MSYSQYETGARVALQRIAAPVATAAALKAIPAEERHDGMLVFVSGTGRVYRFNLASTAADASDTLVIAPTAGSGKWILAEPSAVLKLAVGFATADAAVLFTVPAGMRLQVGLTFWEVTTSFTGGTSSAIGLSSANAAYNTKGDLLGGAAGDVLAGLTAGIPRGTVGAKLASSASVVLGVADTVIFDRITSVFTAGAGFAHVPVTILQ